MKKLVMFLSVILFMSADLVSAQGVVAQRVGRGWCENEQYVLKREQMDISYGYEQGVVNIIRSDKETKVILSVRVGYDNAWVFFSENTFLRDCETGDMYKVRRMEKDIPLAETIWIRDMYNSVLEFTMVFPSLGKDVKRIDFLQYDSNQGTRPMSGNNWKFTDIDLSIFPVKKPKIIL